MIRALTLAAVAALLAFAAPAHAALTMTKTSDAVIIAGDDGPNRIFLIDGSPAQSSVFAFYTDPDEDVDTGDSGCTSDGGSGGGFENITCPTGSPTVAVFLLYGGNDRLEWYGDAAFDQLSGLGIDFGPGNDSNESGIQGIDTFIDGGADADELFGHDGPSSEVEGGPGDDEIVGGGGSTGEILRGGDGNDAIQGLNGADQIFGDAGGDTLIGGAGGDTIDGGAGQDNVEGDGVPNAFSGNDTLLLADGERDAGSCGFGADSVTVDALDLLPLGDCESVSGPPAGGGPPPPGGGVPAGGSAKVVLAKAKKLSARKRRLSLKVSCPASARGSCSGRVSFTLRFTERGKKRKVNAGSASFTLAPGASTTVSRKLSKKLVRRLRRAKKRTLTVRATSRDNAGQAFTSTRTGTLKLSR